MRPERRRIAVAVASSIVESNRQADRSEHTQRIVLEIASVNHPQHAPADILLAVERIADVAAGEVDSDSVDGEVAAAEVRFAGEVVDAAVDHHPINSKVAAAEGDHFAESGCATERIVAFDVDIERRRA